MAYQRVWTRVLVGTSVIPMEVGDQGIEATADERIVDRPDRYERLAE